MTTPRGGGVGALGLVGLTFFTVSGGAYGTEPVIAGLGPGWGVVALLVVPLVWSVPTALAVAELASALPLAGGYYAWVTRALGPFWGAQEGYWTLAFSAVDLAIYPALFVTYLSALVPSLALPASGDPSPGLMLLRWAVSVCAIIAAFAVNARGAHLVGRSAVAALGLVLAPFVALTALGVASFDVGVRRIADDLGSPRSWPVLGVGLAAALWNYGGWDNVATYAPEVRAPARTYPRALLAAVALVVVAYVAPIVAAVGGVPDGAIWSDPAGFPAIAAAMGGRWLGAAVAALAVVSAFALLCSQMLYVAHLPAAMADDGWLPRRLSRRSQGAPRDALVVVCVAAAAASALSFGRLVVLDVLLYGAALTLELVALVVLRAREPGLARPFRVPGGAIGLAAVVACPPACVAMVAWVSAREPGGPLQLCLVLATLAVSAAVARARLARMRVDGPAPPG